MASAARSAIRFNPGHGVPATRRTRQRTDQRHDGPASGLRREPTNRAGSHRPVRPTAPPVEPDARPARPADDESPPSETPPSSRSCRTTRAPMVLGRCRKAPNLTVPSLVETRSRHRDLIILARDWRTQRPLQRRRTPLSRRAAPGHSHHRGTVADSAQPRQPRLTCCRDHAFAADAVPRGHPRPPPQTSAMIPAFPSGSERCTRTTTPLRSPPSGSITQHTPTGQKHHPALSNVEARRPPRIGPDATSGPPRPRASPTGSVAGTVRSANRAAPATAGPTRTDRRPTAGNPIGVGAPARDAPRRDTTRLPTHVSHPQATGPNLPSPRWGTRLAAER